MCRIKLGAFIIVCRLTPRCLVMFARSLRSSFGFRPSQAYAPQSSRSHQRFSLLVRPFLVTYGSCHDLTAVVTTCCGNSRSIS